MRPLTIKEQNDFDFVEVTEFGSEDIVVIKGVKKTPPPNDGFVYRDRTLPGDTETRWARVMVAE